MAKRKTTATRRNAGATTTEVSDTTTSNPMEQRMLALAEQLGRIAGTVQAKAAAWMNPDALKQELTRVRDDATELLQQLAADAPAAATNTPPARKSATAKQGRSGGVVDAPGKRHRPLAPAGPGVSRARSQAAKLRAAKTMVKTERRRGRG